MNEEFEHEIGREYNKFLTTTSLKTKGNFDTYINFRIMKALEVIAVTLEKINDKTNHK
jgi:hypothetical protein